MKLHGIVVRLVLRAYHIIHISIVKCEVGINFTFIWVVVVVGGHGLYMHCACFMCALYQFYVHSLFSYTPIIIFSLNVVCVIFFFSSSFRYFLWLSFNDDEKWWWFCGWIFHVANLKFSVCAIIKIQNEDAKIAFMVEKSEDFFLYECVFKMNVSIRNSQVAVCKVNKFNFVLLKHKTD